MASPGSGRTRTRPSLAEEDLVVARAARFPRAAWTRGPGTSATRLYDRKRGQSSRRSHPGWPQLTTADWRGLRQAIEADLIFDFHDSMTISAIILTYNEAARLRDCLASATWCDEVIMVDGYSTDNTVEVARKFTDKVFLSDRLGPTKPGRVCRSAQLRTGPVNLRVGFLSRC